MELKFKQALTEKLFDPARGLRLELFDMLLQGVKDACKGKYFVRGGNSGSNAKSISIVKRDNNKFIDTNVLIKVELFHDRDGIKLLTTFFNGLTNEADGKQFILQNLSEGFNFLSTALFYEKIVEVKKDLFEGVNFDKLKAKVSNTVADAKSTFDKISLSKDSLKSMAHASARQIPNPKNISDVVAFEYDPDSIYGEAGSDFRKLINEVKRIVNQNFSGIKGVKINKSIEVAGYFSIQITSSKPLLEITFTQHPVDIGRLIIQRIETPLATIGHVEANKKEISKTLRKINKGFDLDISLEEIFSSYEERDIKPNISFTKQQMVAIQSMKNYNKTGVTPQNNSYSYLALDKRMLNEESEASYTQQALAQILSEINKGIKSSTSDVQRDEFISQFLIGFFKINVNEAKDFDILRKVKKIFLSDSGVSLQNLRFCAFFGFVSRMHDLTTLKNINLKTGQGAKALEFISSNNPILQSTLSKLAEKSLTFEPIDNILYDPAFYDMQADVAQRCNVLQSYYKFEEEYGKIVDSENQEKNLKKLTKVSGFPKNVPFEKFTLGRTKNFLFCGEFTNFKVDEKSSNRVFKRTAVEIFQLKDNVYNNLSGVKSSVKKADVIAQARKEFYSTDDLQVKKQVILNLIASMLNKECDKISDPRLDSWLEDMVRTDDFDDMTRTFMSMDHDQKAFKNLQLKKEKDRKKNANPPKLKYSNSKGSRKIPGISDMSGFDLETQASDNAPEITSETTPEEDIELMPLEIPEEN